MSRFSSNAGGYQKACTLIKQLKIAGIEANITAGGISIYCEPNQVNIARAICEKLSASFDAGYTSHQENIMMQTKVGYNELVRVTNDAIAVIKEWK